MPWIRVPFSFDFPQLLIVLLFLPVRLSDGRISISSPFRDFWQISHDVISGDPALPAAWNTSLEVFVIL